MNMWSERSSDGKVQSAQSSERDAAKQVLAPFAEKEADQGVKPFDPINFQEVLSPENYEAEFAMKEDDIIFHIWPWKLHEADKNGRVRPRFKKDFVQHLNFAFGKVFFSRWTFEFDEDMGSYFVKATGFGASQFARELALEAMEVLHKEMSRKE